MFCSGALARAGLLCFGSSVIFSDCAGDVYGPPCFQASYRVELLERLPESTCKEDWAEAWIFEVEPKSLSASGACQQTALEFTGPPPPLHIANVAGTPFPGPVEGAGAVATEYPYSGMQCDVRAGLGALLPGGYEDVAAAVADDAVIWTVPVVNNDSARPDCTALFPPVGHCTNFYRSKMTKIADWDWENQ